MSKTCPKCRDVLPDSATGCSCGWVAPETKPANITAAAVANSNDASDTAALTEARAYCLAHGLTTRAKQLEFMRTSRVEIGKDKFRDKAYWQQKALETLKKPGVSVAVYEQAADYLRRNPIREAGEDPEAAA